MLLKMTCKMNLTEVTPFLQWGDTLGIKKKKRKRKENQICSLHNHFKQSAFLFSPLLPKIEFEKI